MIAFVGVSAQIADDRPARGLLPSSGQIARHFREIDLPVAHANGAQITVGTEVKDLFPLAWAFARQQIHLVEAIEMGLEGLAVCLDAALLELRLDIGVDAAVGSGQQSWQPVFLRKDVIDDRARLDLARPAYELRHAESAFTGESLFTLEGVGTALRPGEDLGAVIGRKDHDRVVGDLQLVELVKQLSGHIVELGHAVGKNALSGLVLVLLVQMDPDVATRGPRLGDPVSYSILPNHATLASGGWLNLTRWRLSLHKKRQACLTHYEFSFSIEVYCKIRLVGHSPGGITIYKLSQNRSFQIIRFREKSRIIVIRLQYFNISIFY